MNTFSQKNIHICCCPASLLSKLCMLPTMHHYTNLCIFINKLSSANHKFILYITLEILLVTKHDRCTIMTYLFVVLVQPILWNIEKDPFPKSHWWNRIEACKCASSVLPFSQSLGITYICLIMQTRAKLTCLFL